MNEVCVWSLVVIASDRALTVIAWMAIEQKWRGLVDDLLNVKLMNGDETLVSLTLASVDSLILLSA